MTESSAPKPIEAAPAASPAKPAAVRKPRKPRKPPAPPPPTMHSVAVLASAIVMLDQFLKYIVIHLLNLDTVREIDLIDPWINLRMAWNQGVNFGMLSSESEWMPWVLIAVGLVICGWVWIWLSRMQHTRLARISAGLLIGGAIGNVIDRALYGAVVDFLNMSLPNWRNPFSFNVADISIFAGAIGLFIWPPSAPKPAPKAPRKRTTTPRPKPKAAEKDSDKTRDAAAK